MALCGIVALGLGGLPLGGCESKKSDSSSAGTKSGAGTQSGSTSATSPAGPSGSGPSANANLAAVTLPPGWGAVYTGSDGHAQKEIKSFAPTPTFTLAPEESIDPGLAAAGWSAAYTADLKIADAGSYRFTVVGEGGEASISVYDAKGNELGAATAPAAPGTSRVQTTWMQLPSGSVQVTVKYKRQNAASRLRVLWEQQRSDTSTGFEAEPIPTAVATVPGFARAGAAQSLSELHGRVLLGELGCIHCHATEGHDHAGGAAHGKAPVLARMGPVLGDVSRRADPNWLIKWVMDPHTLRPGTPMPRVLGSDAKAGQDAEAVVHFLAASYKPETAGAPATEPAVLAKGRTLYHTVGCVACHGAIEAPSKVFDQSELPGEVPKVSVPAPWGNMAGKWNAPALAEFLKDPAKVRPQGRMPSMALSAEEADLIATYLVSTWGAPQGGAAAFKPDPAKADAGRAVFATRGCAACHELGADRTPVASELKAPSLATLAVSKSMKGCLDAADTRTPRFTLTDADRADLLAGIASVASASGAPAPVERQARVAMAFNCLQCHDKDGQGGVAEGLKPYFHTRDEAELGDEGRLPPRLNLVGWKLNTPWLRTVLFEAGRARPYMATRMPQFGKENLGTLAEELTKEAGFWPDRDDKEPASTDSMVVAGRTLVGDGGLNCISCHVFGKFPPAGTPGPNIVNFAERLRYDWWQTYARAPQRQKPGTRMPSFFITGTSTVTAVLAGDPHAQIDALWSYFRLSNFAPPPQGLSTGAGYTVAVGDTPRIFRSFMKDAGSRGIAVGYPQGLHFGFDATEVRLADAWKGSFIDAAGAWANRGGQVATGQGQAVWTAPAGPALAINVDPQSWPTATGTEGGLHFKGYTLDKAGVPTFEYTLGPALVRERFEPEQLGAAMRRTFEIRGLKAGDSVWLNAGTGAVTVERAENSEPARQVGGDRGTLVGFVVQEAGKPLAFTVTVKF